MMITFGHYSKAAALRRILVREGVSSLTLQQEPVEEDGGGVCTGAGGTSASCRGHRAGLHHCYSPLA